MKRLSIALLSFLLFASVGLSGWTYGPNLVQNGDFETANPSNSSQPDHWFSFDILGWTCNNINETSNPWDFTNYSNGMLNISTNWDSLYTLVADYVKLENDSEFYLNQFDFYLYTDFPLETSMYIMFDLFNSSADCNDDLMNELDTNSTTSVEQIYVNPVMINPTISDLGNGWKRMTSFINMTALYEYYGYYGGVRGAGDINAVVMFWGDSNYLLDNIVIKEAIWEDESCGWNCSTGHMIISQAPLIFGLLVIFVLLGVAFVSGNPILAIISASVVALFGTLLTIVLSGLV